MWGEWSPSDALTPECMRYGAASPQKGEPEQPTSSARKAKAQDFPTSSKIPGAHSLPYPSCHSALPCLCPPSCCLMTFHALSWHRESALQASSSEVAPPLAPAKSCAAKSWT